MTAVGVRQQHGQKGVQAVDHAPQIHAEHPLPVREGLVRDQATAADTGVVAEQMRGSEPLTHLVGKRLHGGGVADIGAHPDDAELVRSRSERACLDVRDHDVHAHVAEASRKGLADATPPPVTTATLAESSRMPRS